MINNPRNCPRSLTQLRALAAPGVRAIAIRAEQQQVTETQSGWRLPARRRIAKAATYEQDGRSGTRGWRLRINNFGCLPKRPSYPVPWP